MTCLILCVTFTSNTQRMFPFGFLTVLFLIRVTQASSEQALPVPVPFTKTLKVYWGWNVPKLGTTEMQLVEEVTWREMVCKVTVAPEALVTITAETRSESWSECITGKKEQNCSYGMSVPQRHTDVSAHHWLVVLCLAEESLGLELLVGVSYLTYLLCCWNSGTSVRAASILNK